MVIELMEVAEEGNVRGHTSGIYPYYCLIFLLLFRLAYIFVCYCLATTLLQVVVSKYSPYLIITGTPLLF